MTAPKPPQGFAAHTPERRREIAAMGGKAAPDSKRGFSDPNVARRAALKRWGRMLDNAADAGDTNE